jgi:hypothetical protein
VKPRFREWNDGLEIRNKRGAGFHDDPRALSRGQISGRMNLCCRLLCKQDLRSGIDMNRALNIVATKQTGGTLHQYQMSKTRKIRVEQARDLEGYFAIAVANGRAAISQRKRDIEPALAADFGN